MNIVETELDGLLVIEPEVKEDERGSFFRTFAKEELSNSGITFEVAQANMSKTTKMGAIRGMHFQNEPKAEDKIVQCLAGQIYDVAIDLRKSSETFGKWFGIELSGENHKMLLMPKGFAHGFQTLTDNCDVHYYMSEYYAPDLASGVRYDDPLFDIDWPLPIGTVSEKDRSWPLVEEVL